MKSVRRSEQGSVLVIVLLIVIALIAAGVTIYVTDFQNSAIGQFFRKPFSIGAKTSITIVDQNDRQLSQTTSASVRVKLEAPWPITYQPFSLIKTANAQTTDSLVGWWKFDETTKWNNNCQALSVIDSSANNLSGKSCARDRGPTTANLGKRGFGRDFSGQRAYVKVEDNSMLDFRANQDFSLSLWYKSTNQKRSSFLLSKGAGDTGDTGYALILFDGKTPTLALSRNREKARLLLSGPATNDENWHLLTATINRQGNAILYIDGKSVSRTNVSGYNVNLSNDYPLTIGCHSSGTNNRTCYIGRIDDVRVYNRVLSASEVDELMNGDIALPSIEPTATPTATPTPLPTLIQQITVSESADFAVNPLVINPVTTNPAYTDYNFSNATPGTKTLYARFTATTGQTQDTSTTIQLVALPTPTPTPVATATPTPTPVVTPTPTATPVSNYEKSVMDYGAKGDGVTDDTNAFKLAIAGAPAGGTLWVPKTNKFYNIKGSINVNKGIKIVGEGSTLQKSTLGVMFNLQASNITIDNLRIIGPGALVKNTGVGLYSETAGLTGLVLQNNYLEGWGDGIALVRTAGVKIYKNRIYSTQYAGIALTSTIGSYLGAGKPTVTELRSGQDLTDRFSIVLDSNTIYDVKGQVGDGSRNGYGITISDDGTLQPAKALVVRNWVEYVNTWECYDTHAGRELYFLDNYCYMSIRGFNLTSDKRYSNKVVDVYAVRNVVVKGPQGPVPSGIGVPGDNFSSSGGAKYASLESIVLVDSSANAPAAGGIYDNKLFGYGYTGWAGIDVRDYKVAPVEGNICYQSVTVDWNSPSKSCP